MARIIDRADAFRLAVLDERSEKIRTQIALLHGQLTECLHMRELHARSLGLAPGETVATEPGGIYEVGTVLDSQGKQAE